MEKILIILFILIASIHIGKMQAFALYNEDFVPPGPDEVHISGISIIMPLKKILLVRKGSEYCAIKFTKAWSENTSEVGSIFVAKGSDEYATYELYYQGDSSGDFSRTNVQFRSDKLSFPKPRGIGRLAFSFGNKEIKCGSIKLDWFGKGSVYFSKEGQKEVDSPIELAPTKWSFITQANVFDTRLKWYRYDESRKRVNIPIDKLWEDKAE